MTSAEADPERLHKPKAVRIARLWTVAWGLAPAALYVLAMVTLAAMDSQAFDDVLCFHPDRMPLAGFLRQAVAAVAIFAAVCSVFAAPGVLGTMAVALAGTIRHRSRLEPVP